jgi:hypothetical protein
MAQKTKIGRHAGTRRFISARKARAVSQRAVVETVMHK